MIIVPKYFLTLAFVSLATAQTKDAAPVSNLDIAKRFFVKESVQQVARVYANPMEIFLRVNPENTLGRWIREQMIDAAVAEKMRVTVVPKPGQVRVEMDSLTFTIRYSSLNRKMLFFRDKYRRQIQSRYHLRITEPSGRIRVSQLFRFMYADTLKSDELSRVENSNFAFTRGLRTSSKTLNKWVEPVLLTASTLAVFVLFYTLRSGK